MPMKTSKSLTIRVAVVDDHQLLCGAFAELLSYDPRISIVAQANDETQAMSIFRRSDIDVVLLDLRLGETDGLKLLEFRNSEMAVCILTMHTEPHLVAECIRAGALGYVTKFSAP